MTSTDPATANKVYTKELGRRPLVAKDTDQWIAVGGMILRVTTGSASYGTEMRDHSDQDEMGICIESPRTVIGGRRFEQYSTGASSKASSRGLGTLTLRCSRCGNSHTLPLQGTRQYFFLSSRPTPRFSIQPSSAKNSSEIVICTCRGLRLSDLLATYDRNGTCSSENEQELTAQNSSNATDTTSKQPCTWSPGLPRCGVLSTGQISLPMKGDALAYCRRVRQGGVKLDEVLKRSKQLEEQVVALRSTSRLPERPDLRRIDDFLIKAHKEHWEW